MNFKNLLILFVFTFLGCSADENNGGVIVSKNRGDIVSISKTGTYTANQIKQVIQSQGYDIDILDHLVHTVEVNKVVYLSTNLDGDIIEVSGTILVPQGDEAFSLLGYNHGTVFHRDNVTSVNITNVGEGLVGLMMASLGFATTIPDYQGYGQSTDLHPYLISKAASTNVIDILRAAKTHLASNSVSLNNQLFLFGYSEGGYVTLAAQKEIEANYSSEFSITAVAPMAGPYDLSNTLKNVFEAEAYPFLPNLAFALTAYNEYYGWNKLDDMFKAPYAQQMTTLFNGSLSSPEIENQLPGSFNDLMEPAFVQSVLDGSATDVIQAFKENTLLDWTPKSPIRFYHGDADMTVPYYNASAALENLEAASNQSVELVTFNGKDHDTANLPSVIGAIEWFYQLKQ